MKTFRGSEKKKKRKKEIMKKKKKGKFARFRILLKRGSTELATRSTEDGS